jgi:hypothetical protein
MHTSSLRVCLYRTKNSAQLANLRIVNEDSKKK